MATSTSVEYDYNKLCYRMYHVGIHEKDVRPARTATTATAVSQHLWQSQATHMVRRNYHEQEQRRQIILYVLWDFCWIASTMWYLRLVFSNSEPSRAAKMPGWL